MIIKKVNCLKNFKLEILIYILFIILYFLAISMKYDFSKVFNDKRKIDIISIFIIFIAFYMIFISIIIVFIIGNCKRSLEKRLERQLFFGTTEIIITIFAIIYIPSITLLNNIVLMSLICNSMISFLKFWVILMK